MLRAQAPVNFENYAVLAALQGLGPSVRWLELNSFLLAMLSSILPPLSGRGSV